MNFGLAWLPRLITTRIRENKNVNSRLPSDLWKLHFAKISDSTVFMVCVCVICRYVILIIIISSSASFSLIQKYMHKCIADLCQLHCSHSPIEFPAVMQFHSVCVNICTQYNALYTFFFLQYEIMPVLLHDIWLTVSG